MADVSTRRSRFTDDWPVPNANREQKMSDRKTANNPLLDYWTDAAQRYVLSLDVLRQRGNDYVAPCGTKAPHVLTFTVGADDRRPHSCRARSITAWSGSFRPRA